MRNHVALEATLDFVAAFAVDAPVEHLPLRMRTLEPVGELAPFVTVSGRRRFDWRLEQRRARRRRVAETNDGDRGQLLRPARGLQFCGDGLGAPKHAKDVPPRGLLDLVVGITPAEQLRYQIWIRRHVFEADDDAGDAVEVAAEPDVIDAGHFLDVIDVIRDLK